MTSTWAAGFAFNKVSSSHDRGALLCAPRHDLAAELASLDGLIDYACSMLVLCCPRGLSAVLLLLTMTGRWCSCCCVCQCHADRRVPYDPHLPSVFDGEEYSKFARLWTRYCSACLPASPSQAIACLRAFGGSVRMAGDCKECRLDQVVVLCVA